MPTAASASTVSGRAPRSAKVGLSERAYVDAAGTMPAVISLLINCGVSFVKGAPNNALAEAPDRLCRATAHTRTPGSDRCGATRVPQQWCLRQYHYPTANASHVVNPWPIVVYPTIRTAREFGTRTA